MLSVIQSGSSRHTWTTFTDSQSDGANRLVPFICFSSFYCLIITNQNTLLNETAFFSFTTWLYVFLTGSVILSSTHHSGLGIQPSATYLNHHLYNVTVNGSCTHLRDFFFCSVSLCVHLASFFFVPTVLSLNHNECTATDFKRLWLLNLLILHVWPISAFSVQSQLLFLLVVFSI